MLNLSQLIDPLILMLSRTEYYYSFCYSKLQGFSALQEDDSPWESGNVWSNLALYLFSLHIPFSFGGLSVVALFNGQPVLDPQTEVTFVISSFISQNHLIKPLCHPNIRILFFCLLKIYVV